MRPPRVSVANHSGCVRCAATYPIPLGRNWASSPPSTAPGLLRVRDKSLYTSTLTRGLSSCSLRIAGAWSALSTTTSYRWAASFSSVAVGDKPIPYHHAHDARGFGGGAAASCAELVLHAVTHPAARTRAAHRAKSRVTAGCARVSVAFGTAVLPLFGCCSCGRVCAFCWCCCCCLFF